MVSILKSFENANNRFYHYCSVHSKDMQFITVYLDFECKVSVSPSEGCTPTHWVLWLIKFFCCFFQFLRWSSSIAALVEVPGIFFWGRAILVFRKLETIEHFVYYGMWLKWYYYETCFLDCWYLSFLFNLFCWKSRGFCWICQWNKWLSINIHYLLIVTGYMRIKGKSCLLRNGVLQLGIRA